MVHSSALCQSVNHSINKLCILVNGKQVKSKAQEWGGGLKWRKN